MSGDFLSAVGYRQRRQHYESAGETHRENKFQADKHYDAEGN